MKHKKVLGLLLSLALLICIAVPSTLAMQSDSDSSETPVILSETPAADESVVTGETPANEVDTSAKVQTPVEGETPVEGQTPVEGETPAEGQTPVEGETPAEGQTPVEGETPAEGNTPVEGVTPVEDETSAVSEEPTETVCTCIANEDGSLTYTEGCPVHTVKEETEPECTCIANEDGTLTYTEGCPVHDPEEKFVHIDGCSEECTDEECPCLCHTFKRLMECQNYDEFMLLLNAISNEDYAKFTKKQVKQIEQKLLELKPSCTCSSTDGTHIEGCPLYVAPTVEFQHIEGCFEGCTNEECSCTCHLFERLMKCETLEELMTLISETPEDALMALSDEEADEVDAKIRALEPQPLPPVEIEESNDEPIVSEIVYTTVNYAWAAPFGAPVEG